MTVEYTAEQDDAINKAVDWLATFPDMGREYFVLTGYAGTGKTTCIREIIERAAVESVHFAAFTGKAARVIQRVSGYNTSTIHALIYSFVPPDKELCENLYAQLHGDDAEQDVAKRQIIQKELDEAQQPRFERNEDSQLKHVDLLVLDECSMVNQEMLNDLLDFGKPIIALGDPGQLPPIDGTGALFAYPADAHLEQIHRQAEGNPIIEASFKARKGIPWAQGAAKTDSGSFTYFDVLRFSNDALSEALLKADHIICGKHATRREFNVKLRQLRDFDITDPYPQVDEKLVCRQNNKDLGLYNGDLMTVVKRGELYDTFIELWLVHEAEPNDPPVKVRALRAYFDEYFEPDAMKRVQWWERKENQEFDFGYVTTIHTAQGSQWDRLIVIDDGLFRNWRKKAKERKQLLYTAVTRAAQNLVVLYKR